MGLVCSIFSDKPLILLKGKKHFFASTFLTKFFSSFFLSNRTKVEHKKKKIDKKEK